MVLFLDDLDVNLDLFKAAAGNLPHRRHLNPSSALDCLKTRSARVIVTDQAMPFMLGTEFIARARRICPNAHIIMVSSDPPTQFEPESLAALVITKPFDTLTLRRRLNSLLRAP